MGILTKRKNRVVLWIIAFMLVALSALVERIFDINKGQISIAVEETNFDSKSFSPDPARTVIKAFDPKIMITAHPQIKITEGNFLLQFFAPAENIFYDAIYFLLIISIGLSLLISMKKFNINEPFSSKMAEGIKRAGMVCFLFAGLNLLRYKLLSNKIREITDNLYHLEKHYPFSQPEFWMGMFLFWLHTIIKKAESLQKQQELTV